MRILHVMPVYAPAWQYGGPVLSVSRLAEGLARQGVDTRVLTTDAGLPQLPLEHLGRPVERNGVAVTYAPVDHPSGTIRSRALLEALPAALEGVDLVHLSAIWQPLGLPVQRAALRRGIPVLASLRGALGPYSLRQGWWKKLPWFLFRERPLLQRAAGLHVTSLQEEQELVGLGLKAPRFLLPNPLDLETLRPDAQLGRRWRIARGLAVDIPLLLVCGRQHHKKGLDLLPRVLAPLAHRSWQLLMVGGDDDGSGARLRADLEQAGLADRVRWIDTLPAPDLAGVYNAADLLLLPSRHENFGNVVIEALACGAAALISDRTGVSAELAQGGVATVLPRQADLWSCWLEQWLEQPRRAGTSAARWTAERYGQEAVSAAAVRAYTSILQTQGQRLGRA
jgi:glycosyltransferase involved in cell wall biosynthesis